MTTTNNLHAVIVLYPGVTQLDFTGPYQVFMRAPNTVVQVAALEPELVLDGLHFASLTPLGDIQACDLLCIPGGYGAAEAIHNDSFMAEVSRLAQSANTLCSVCTGSLILAAGGFLEGKKATCHWSWLDYLAQFPGVEISSDRVVRDNNDDQAIFTGGGVTAGIDMALTVVGELFGHETAERIQLVLEYNPQPPFNSGSPDSASEHIVESLKSLLEKYNEAPRQLIQTFLSDQETKRLNEPA